MDGLASFAHDPILPLHDDGDSDFGESSDGRAEQSARNGDNADQESNELLQPVFGDGYFNDRKCSVGSVGESSNSVGNKNDRITDYGARGLSPSHELSREQEAEAQLLNSLDNFQSHISSGGQFAELGANHAHAMSTYNISSSTGHDRPTHYMIQNHSSMQPRQSLRVPQNQDSTLVGHQRTEIRDKPPHYLVSSESNQQGITLQTQQNQSVRPIHETASRLVENVLRFPRSVAVMRPMASERPPVTVPSQSDDELVHMSASIMELPGDDSDDASWTETVSKKQRIDAPQPQALLSTRTSPATASHTARTQHMPQWMNGAARLQQQQQQQQQQINPPSRQAVAVHPGATLSDYRPTLIKSHMTPVLSAPKVMQHKPNMLEIPEDYISTWEAPLPSHLYRRPQGRRRYELSLVNVKEFTITGLPISWEGPPSSLAGLRKKIKELSKAHGKATYERTKDGSDGRWRIPIGAYASFYSYLTSEPLCQVVGIPQDQLKIASLGKARLEKGYPSTKKLISLGVPRGLATALAPFQRGGVDFVVEKRGRALIADEMGLGKTVQGIASMAVYHRDWPLLVLTPSSARYHWENEFQHWLGWDSPINKEKQARMNLGGESEGEEEDDDDEEVDESNSMPLLDESQIHVLSSGKDAIFPRRNTKVVICSYGLAPALAASGKIYPGLFRAAIVDESHMLKNMNTKRTKNLVPVLHATYRCVLLSGTPALAKPTELWPQLKILSTEETGWWEEESEFIEKYVKNSSAVRRAELHAMLTGTVMIRRLKNDILKSLPKKSRGKAVVDVSTPEMRIEFHKCMSLLREGKGQLGKLARQHSVLGPIADDIVSLRPKNPLFEKAKGDIGKERDLKYMNRMREIEFALANTRTSLSHAEKEQCKSQMVEGVQRELQVWYQERIHELQEELPQPEDEEISRKSVLNRMYSLTGKSKLPLISSMIKKWLKDATKGKLCVFAHHIFVLDELVRMAGLSNMVDSDSQYIRIDGSTSPKERQAQIKRFQTDPNVRIAILGITAAGVAVTLTAASTVWFAELFWTPALMIQAEDRCHRIGQNSRVHCLYFVATGTLDDLLWKLLEKKFRDLGEFVEGMEKQKLVVHKTYNGTKELDSMFDIPDGSTSDDEVNFDEESDDEDGQEILEYQRDLEDEIELLGKEELTMIRADGDDDDGGDEQVFHDSAEPAAGSTEAEAILLSDDDEEEETRTSAAHDSPTETRTEETSGEERASPAQKDVEGSNKKLPAEASTKLDIRKPLQDCRGYSVVFEGKSFGMNLFIFEGRAVVGGRVGDSYFTDIPALGDILVAVNGQRMPFTSDINQITTFMRTSLQRGPVELIFLELPALRHFVVRKAEKERKRIEELKAKMVRPIVPGPDDIIDLVDDD